MVGGTAHQPQQPPQLAHPSSSSSSTAPTTVPEEDELLKRNTDCVYFLASPLTCKKGSECEYRHSDVARVNPRDCWYWLNGNCLNPKCGFRHPPLDGLLGADVPTPMAPPVPHAAPYATPKQGVACIFFQKGFCLKGHLCPFLHGPPNSANNKPTQSGPINPITEPPKMPYSGPEKSTQEQKFTQPAPVQKPVEFLLPQGKQPPRMQPLPARNGGDKKVPSPPPAPSRVPLPVKNETPSYKSNNRILNGKDADEYSREPSPGFDVLVDNQLEDSEYYRDEDEFGRSRGQNYENALPTDYDYEQRDFDHFNEHRVSSERKTYSRTDSPDWFDESDLRHRIAKQRRGTDNGLKSVISRESHTDRRHHHLHPNQGVLSSRLRGRIKVPGRPISPIHENDSRVERLFHTGRNNPPRSSSHTSFNQSRLRDRIKDNNNDTRDYKGSRGRRDMMSDNDTTFTGPKRLSELKSGRLSDGYEQQMNDRQSLGKRKHLRADNQESAEDLSFEGPKPLSEILKRKRGVETTAPISHVSCMSTKKEIIPESTVGTNKDDYIEKEKSTDGKSTLNYDGSEVEHEEGLIDEDAMLDQELEAYDHRNGDYDYEQIDGEDYNLDEGENVDEEYVDEEDADEYAKKESVTYS